METCESRGFSLFRSFRSSKTKLQKTAPKVKNRDSKRFSVIDATFTTSPLDKVSHMAAIRLEKSPTATVTRQMAVMGQPQSPTHPDLSDSKWGDYVDQTGSARHLEASSSPSLAASPKPSIATTITATSPTSSQPKIIPELSHLIINDAAPRPSTDSSRTIWPDPSHRMSTSRRHAKTPVFQIGQLEKSASMRNANNPCRVDLIAEQYRALLESRGHEEAESIYTASHPAVPTTPTINKVDAASPRPGRRNVHGLELEHRTEPPSPRQDSPASSSPTSDGTLVAFEEDAIYFKPISFSPEPSPSSHRQEFPLNEVQSPSATSEANLGLSISLDLLTKELSSVLLGRNAQDGSGAAALQIWVMIEAYERLQDRIPTMNLPEAEVQNFTTILSSWLKSLHAVHASLTGSDAMSVSDYGGPQVEAD